MSRSRNFPEKLYVGMSKEKSALLLFDKDVADALTAMGQKVATYTIYILPEPRKPRKTGNPTQTPVASQAQDTQPQGQAGGKDTTVGTTDRHRQGTSSRAPESGFGPSLTKFKP